MILTRSSSSMLSAVVLQSTFGSDMNGLLLGIWIELRADPEVQDIAWYIVGTQ